jgi:hypothetical protein
MKREPYLGSFLRDPRIKYPYRDNREPTNWHSVAAWIILAILALAALWVCSLGVFGRGQAFVMPHHQAIAFTVSTYPPMAKQEARNL